MNLKLRLEQVKNLLLGLKKDYPEEFNFVFAAEVPGKNSEEVVSIMGTEKVDLLADFMDIIDEHSLTVSEQALLHTLLQCGDTNIVQCQDDTGFQHEEEVLVRNYYYRIIEIKKKGEKVYYNLENKKFGERYIDYDCKRFERLFTLMQLQ